ncbi:serine/threonine-protein kinase PEPKR2-like isoform X2 [Juglans microcarpa x Juglans regia]|uniref:serine/threonine-protein kinase PEPKR2-like isoform X2 n=1 Tax=Juglans microcarpa x Juglans regia TaxID=2249226 RepID=UPI001B7DEDB3|nr:serine/threonine-protein kinase PEPKR2-like isoform X2 [Juglans microcarpa x Juglans regia]XP_041014516.1 serine/threonine-protein kinase PEPKR2-like isoform X2 [Juglans microcarpa x Juglans regia]
MQYYSGAHGIYDVVRFFSTLICIMEALGKKRKGLEILRLSRNSLKQLTIWSHLSLESSSRHKKKCKEDDIKEVSSSKNIFQGIVTAPPCRSTCPNPPARGLKRKIGCIDAATQMGRKKKIDQDYELGVIIGKGKFGSVTLCRNKVSGEQFACKTLRKGEELVYQEVEIMQHLSGHPGIVTLRAVYEDAESFYLVMEFCSGGRLLDQMAREGNYSEHRAANILKELVLVIKYCHEMGVIHRDIKPENILLTSSGRMKLADFGLAARVSNGQSLAGVVGSPAYVAPEVLIGDYSEKVDIWSAGVLLHALLVGMLPFQGDSVEAIFQAIKKVNLDFESGVWESVSQPARNLIAGMLTRDVSARLTADEVLKQILETSTFKSKTRNRVKLTSKQLTAITGVESERNKTIASSFLSDDSCLNSSSDSSSRRSEEQECGLVDALAVAISRVRISEPKRSRLCSPTSPIRQQRSSNMKLNNLCTAF